MSVEYSARKRCRSSLSRSAISVRRRAVMSRATANIDATRPLRSSICTFWPIHSSRPSMAMAGNSQYVTGIRSVTWRRYSSMPCS
jgi:hypothetical protein